MTTVRQDLVGWVLGAARAALAIGRTKTLGVVATA